MKTRKVTRINEELVIFLESTSKKTGKSESCIIAEALFLFKEVTDEKQKGI